MKLTAPHKEGVGQPSPFARTAYSIMGRVAAAMRDAGVDQSEIDDYLARAMAGDYGNLLKVKAWRRSPSPSPSSKLAATIF